MNQTSWCPWISLYRICCINRFPFVSCSYSLPFLLHSALTWFARQSLPGSQVKRYQKQVLAIVLVGKTCVSGYSLLSASRWMHLITEGSTPGLNSVGCWKQYLYREIYRRRIQEKFVRGSCKPRPTPFPPVISSLRENLWKVSALCVCC